MSKEEIILQQQILKYPNKDIYQVAIIAMKVHADQEKEKVAVAFAEWTWLKQTSELMVEKRLQSYSDLYQYFIKNIYNK